jgi:hypothetical protein
VQVVRPALVMIHTLPKLGDVQSLIFCRSGGFGRNSPLPWETVVLQTWRQLMRGKSVDGHAHSALLLPPVL